MATGTAATASATPFLVSAACSTDLPVVVAACLSFDGVLPPLAVAASDDFDFAALAALAPAANSAAVVESFATAGCDALLTCCVPAAGAAAAGVARLCQSPAPHAGAAAAAAVALTSSTTAAASVCFGFSALSCFDLPDFWLVSCVAEALSVAGCWSFCPLADVSEASSAACFLLQRLDAVARRVVR